MKANVLVVDDDLALQKLLADRFKFWGHAVQVAGNGSEAVERVKDRSFDLILLDLNMPKVSGMTVIDSLRGSGCEADIVVLTAHGTVERAVEAMKRGADDFLTKPADFDHLKKVIDRALDKRRLDRVNAALSDHIAAEGGLVTGESPAMQDLLRTATKAAVSESTILLTGESGTGKQLLAEHIHRTSPRAPGPFVYVNCVAISDELIESTLFGHEKGAFTGAVSQKRGRLEIAAGGTAFLDEIGDISGTLQTKLLHFLESGEFERVGGNQTVNVDIRIIAATNRDLLGEVGAGRFREDLYYRLNVITLELPNLRNRREDIPVLAEAFLARYRKELKRETLTFDPHTLQAMREYPWPGNVRQLKNAVERMVVLAEGPTLTEDQLPPEILRSKGSTADDILEMPWEDSIRSFKQRMIQHALKCCDGNQTKAAKKLGLQRTYLNRLIRELERSEEDG